MRFFRDYDRSAAVRYAHRWAYGRNPAFYDYEELGGDCTNFASQCSVCRVRDHEFHPGLRLVLHRRNQKSPSWTGVPYLWNFLHPEGALRGAHRAPPAIWRTCGPGTWCS